MKKSYKAASSIGTVGLVLSGSVMAAAPAFDNWTVTNGVVTSGACASGFSCGSALTDLGFFQRMIVSGSQTYFQTIITENNANAANSADLESLTFSDESFVRTGNQNGIADKQRIYEKRANATTGSTTFRASTQLGSGWEGNYLTLKQYLYDDSDNFQTDFLFKQTGLNTNPTSQGMKITAYVPIQGTDDQEFVLVQQKGSYVPSSGTILFAPDNDSTTGLNTLSWAAGNNIKAVWVGQDLNQIVGQVFGFESYQNLTTGGQPSVARFSLTDQAPKHWDTTVWGLRDTQGTISDPF